MTTLAPEVERLIAQADEEFQLGNLKAASAFLTQAAKLETASSAAHLALGFISFQLEDFEVARTAFTRAAELDKTNVAAHTNLAIVLQRLGRLVEAESALRAALDLDAASPELLHLLAMLQMERAQYVPAAQLLYKLLERKPEDANLWAALGKCFYKEGDLFTARDCFNYALQNSPNHGVALENLAALETGSLVAA